MSFYRPAPQGDRRRRAASTNRRGGRTRRRAAGHLSVVLRLVGGAVDFGLTPDRCGPATPGVSGFRGRSADLGGVAVSRVSADGSGTRSLGGGGSGVIVSG